MSLYLDASILVSLFIDDALSDRADRAFRRKHLDFIVSDLAAAEFPSAIARRVRMRQLTEREARDAFVDFDIWIAPGARVEATPQDMRIANAHLRSLRFTLRTPDALHLAMTDRLNAELATFDEGPIETARQLALPIAAL